MISSPPPEISEPTAFYQLRESDNIIKLIPVNILTEDNLPNKDIYDEIIFHAKSVVVSSASKHAAYFQQDKDRRIEDAIKQKEARLADWKKFIDKQTPKSQSFLAVGDELSDRAMYCRTTFYVIMDGLDEVDRYWVVK